MRSKNFTSKILITGHHGFIGSNLIKYLRKTNSLLAYLEADIRKANNIKNIISSFKPDIVYHLASYGNSPEHKDIQRIYDTNIKGMANIIKYIPDHTKLVFTSTSSVYGNRSNIMREQDKENPNSHYAISKLCAEKMALLQRPATILRLFSVYGPNEASYRLIPTLTRNILNNKEIQLSDGVRDFVYIDDVIKAIIYLTNQNGIFNIGTGKQYSTKNILDILVKLLGQEQISIVYHQVLRPWESKVWKADISKVMAIGWEPTTSIYEGLKKYLQSIGISKE